MLFWELTLTITFRCYVIIAYTFMSAIIKGIVEISVSPTMFHSLIHSTNEDLLNIKRKGDPNSRTLSRTSDTTETRNPCVAKVILLACFTYIDIFFIY